MNAITVSGLIKDYWSVRAVDRLSFTVAPGEIVALAGPPRAGKTTVIEILAGQRHRTAGEVRVIGFDPATGGRAFWERIGAVPTAGGCEGSLTVKELLRRRAGRYPRRHDLAGLLDLVDLGREQDARVCGLAAFQRRRLELALGLAGAPEVLLLDTSTAVLDTSTSVLADPEAGKLLARLRELGTTVLLTVRDPAAARLLADRVVVLDHGHLIRPGHLNRVPGPAQPFPLPRPLSLVGQAS